MGRKVVTEQQRQRLLKAFREDISAGSPASFRRAGLAAAVDFRTAKRSWERGWPNAKPIRDLIESERVLSRAAFRREVLAQRLEAATALAMEDAAEARAEQGKSIRAVEATATNGLIALHAEGIVTYMRHLAATLQNKGTAAGTYGDPGAKEAVAARHALGDLALIVRRFTASARLGVEMERLLFGEPTTILGGEVGIRPVTPVNADAVTMAAEAEAALRAAEELRLLEAAKKGGGDGDGDGTSSQPN